MQISVRTLIASLVVTLFAAAAQSSTVTLSDVSSDLTPASTLDATFDFVVIGGDTLQLTVTNDTSGADQFNIVELFWNGSSAVSGLSLLSANHSAVGDVSTGWDPVQAGLQPDGFGVFDYALIDGVGEGNPNIIGPTESILFTIAISGSCADSFSCTGSDFVVPQSSGYVAAAKFVNGPDDPEAPGVEDSAFGAAVPEPSTAVMLGLGLAALAARRRIA